MNRKIKFYTSANVDVNEDTFPMTSAHVVNDADSRYDIHADADADISL